MTYSHYTDHIAAYEREFKEWERRAEKIVKRYRDDERDDREGGAKFNVLWSNVQTLKAATYSRTPEPDVSRRFKDNDPVGRVASLLLERTLDFQVRHFRDFGASIRQCIYDRFLGGRGTAWVRYEPTYGEESREEGAEITEDAESQSEVGQEILDEDCPVDYVHWRDFGHAVSRTWEECTLVWRKVYLTEQAAEARFPDVTLPQDTVPDERARMKANGGDEGGVNKRALVYELWDKETGNAIWLSKSIGKILDEKQDPLGLEEFFPCPPPLYATLTTDSLVPLPDFTLYQDQANELDLLSTRIDGLVKALQLKGVYDASQPELARLFTEAGNTDLIPVKNWNGFAEKKGLQGAIDLVEILPIAQALNEAYKAFDQVKNQIYELTGISDILRGETMASETATAQKIKNSYASLRLKVYQDEVEVFATRLLQLKAEIICNHYDPDTILKMACADQLTEEDQQFIVPAIQMLKSGVTRAFRIEVATDSMVYQDEQQEKNDRMEFLNATSGFLKLLAEVGQVSPSMVPMGVEMLKFGVTGFRVGKNLEGTIDQAVEHLKAEAKQQAAQPKPNPEAMKAQAAQGVAQVRAQAAQQTTQMSEQAETQRTQMELQAKQQSDAADRDHEAQIEAMKAGSAERDRHVQLQIAQLASGQKAQSDQLNGVLQQILQRMKGETAIDVAEVAADATLDAAQISASAAAEQGTADA